MRSLQLFSLSLLFGSPDFYLLENLRTRFFRFFREKPLPGYVPAWRSGPRHSRAVVRGFRVAAGKAGA